MTRDRVSDDLPPSSALPTAESADHSTDHTHPFPRGFRVLLVTYGIVLGLALAGLFGLYLTERNSSIDRADRVADETLRLEQETQARAARVAEEVAAELDRRTDARDAEQARIEAELQVQRDRLRDAVCVVLTSGDLGQSPRIVDLARELECP